MRRRLAALALAGLAIVPSGGTAVAAVTGVATFLSISACGGGETEDDEREGEDDD